MKTLEQIGSRNYIVEHGKKLKMIPIDYLELDFNLLCDLIDFTEKKLTLSDKDRYNIEVFIFETNLKRIEKYVYELVDGKKPIKALSVSVNMGAERYELEYDNGVKLKCPKAIYDYSESKGSYFSNF